MGVDSQIESSVAGTTTLDREWQNVADMLNFQNGMKIMQNVTSDHNNKFSKS
jgi:hypothetical protein